MTALITKNPRAQLLFHKTTPARRKVESFAELIGVFQPGGGEFQTIPPFAISSFEGPGPLEIGADLIQPAFTASYVGVPTSAVLTDSEGSPSKSVLADPENFNSDGSFFKTQPLEEVGFVLTASSGGVSAQETHAVEFWPRIFVGVEDPLSVGGGDETFIESLLIDQLQGSAAGLFNLTVPSGKRIFMAMPDAFVSLFQPVFSIGGALPGGMADLTTGILVTAATPNAVAVPYTLFMSQFGNFGSTTLEVTDGA